MDYKLKSFEKFTLNESKTQEKIVATNGTIKKILNNEIERLGLNADLNHIDVSQVTNMSGIFKVFYSTSRFTGDISNWDVSNVYDMDNMFEGSQFNGDISKWDVSNVTSMWKMFQNSKFNSDISEWNVSKVKDMAWMFSDSLFNKDISKWDVNSNSTYSMFYKSQFDGDITKWKIPLEEKIEAYSHMKAFQDLNKSIIEQFIKKAIEKDIPLTSETLNYPPFKIRVTSSRYGL